MSARSLYIEYRVNSERHNQIVQMVPSLPSQSQDLVAQGLGGRHIELAIVVKRVLGFFHDLLCGYHGS
jgi:hypothetical protein